MNISEFQKATASPAPVYLLITDQDYLRKLVYEHCLRQVAEAARAFDWAVFDLAEEAARDLVQVARTLPWMGPRRWVYGKNATSGDQAQLLAYLKQPSERTVLVLEMNKLPAGWPAVQIIKPADQMDLKRWLERKVAAAGYEAAPGAIETLVEIVGEDLQLLESEVEKQLLYCLESKLLTVQSVQEMALQGRRYDVFALSNAMAEGKTGEALRVLDRILETGMTAPLIIATLYSNFRRLLAALEMLERKRPFQEALRQTNCWSYRERERQVRRYRPEVIREILLQLHASDRLCKTTQTNERTHLERVVIDTCERTSI
jgi:DNA polymerase III subunit delta